MSDAPEQRRPQSPVMIEEEPAHEFYANLLGKKPATVARSPTFAASTVDETFVHSRRASSSSQVSLVPDYKDDSPTKGPETSFSRQYKRALSDPPKLSSLALDGTNKGYQMLEKLGWSERGGGLGRQRQGEMLPVKTVLKQDKKGLGCGKQKKARITHSAEKASSKGSSKRNNPASETKAQRRLRRKREAEKESRKEKRIRMLLRSDISDDYEQLYMNLHPK